MQEPEFDDVSTAHRTRPRSTALAIVGGGVAAAVLIGTPLALQHGDSGGDPGPAAQATPTVADDPPPEPSPTDTDTGTDTDTAAPEPPPSSADPAGDVPAPPPGTLADFPLTTGYPETNGNDRSPVTASGTPGLGRIDLCGSLAWDPADGPVAVLGAEYAGEAEDFRGRTLAVYDSAAAADAALDQMADVLDACPVEELGDDSGASLFERLEDTAGDRSVAWTQRYRSPDGFTDTGLTVYHLVRVGSAVLGAYEYGEGGGSPESISNAVERASGQLPPLLAAMAGLGLEPGT